MLSVLTVAPALLCATLLQQQPQEPDRGVLEIIPLQQFCSEQPRIVPPLWTTAMAQPYDGDDGVDLLGVTSRSVQFDPSAVADFLQELNEEALSENQVALDVDGDSIVILGDSATIAALRKQVRDLSRVVGRPIEIEVAFWRPADGDPDSTILSRADYERLAASRRPAWRRTTTSRSSVPVALDSSRWTRYVSDVAVEIASKSAISRPQTDAFFEGSHVVVLPHALVGGEFAAHVQFAWAERMGPVQRVTTGIPESAQLDAPSVASVCGGFSGRVDEGGALCVTMNGDESCGASGLLTVRLSSQTLPASPETAGVGIFPISALTTPALNGRVAPPPSTGGMLDPRDFEVHVGDNEGGFGYFERDRLLDLVISSLDDDEQSTTSLRTGGGHLVVHGAGDVIARVGTMLQALEDRLLATVTVDHRIDLEAGAADRSPPPLHHLMAPTLLGRYVTLARRAETTVIADLNVEVAEDSRAVDPTVRLLQFGCWLRARVVAHDDRAHLALLAQMHHCTLPEARQVQPAGSLSLTEVASQRIAHDAVLVGPQTIPHGDGPIVDVRGEKHRSGAITTVRW